MKKAVIALSALLVVAIVVIAFLLGRQSSKPEAPASTENVAEETLEAEDKDNKEATTEAAKGASTVANGDVAYTVSGSWESNGMTATQVNAIVYNYKTSDVNNWKVEIDVPSGSKLEQSWNGTFDLKGSKLTVTAVDYNGTIAAGGSVDFGFILDTKGDFKPENTLLALGDESITVKGLGGNNEAPDDDDDDDELADSDDEDDVEDSKKIVLNEKDPVKVHGELSVKGTKIVDEKGDPYQLKGVSTHGIAWFPEYVNKDAFKSLKENYNVNMIRLAMYSDPNAGYTEDMHKKVKEGVKYASELGMYVIIDWHILNDNNPNTDDNIKRAKKFFKEMSKAYEDYDNVLYEICNEPNGGTTWENDIKPYAKKIIKVIRENDDDAIIIIGTPTWSQDVDVVAKSPLKGKNLIYALHFYAATHKDDLRNKAVTAIDSGLPLFISEFSICDASGSGGIDKASAKEWFKLIKKYDLSCATWSLCNKDETASLLKPTCKKTGDFKDSDLTTQGKWILSQYSKY
ncbi:MAG: cellulase family glycosylhydrolase [Lachnospiraceae bacterium]|nr:cellulase family glycosylhydrolase [Lachnospiraceae bacterium]